MNKRKFKCFVTDVDGVLTKIDSVWQYIHEKLNVVKEAKINYDLYHNGKIDYFEWARRDITLWKGTRYEEFIKIIRSVEIRKGSDELFKYLHEKGLKVIAISGGLTPLLEYLHEKFKFDAYVANDIIFQNGVVCGKFRINVKPHNKGRILRKVLKNFNLDPKDCIGIGDSKFDVPMLKLCGYSIAFNPKDERLLKICDEVIHSEDLYRVLKRIKSLIND